MAVPAINVYDAVTYVGYPFPQTHPDRLATLATLFGLRPAPVTGCRVLELGCGDGGNLIPMAFGLPESSFLGVDLAASAVARGRAIAAEIGLSNIDLRCADIMELGQGYGKFDYIVAHGIYSWVPSEVRERILDLCRELLTPHGVAYISYNTYPGYHLRKVAREMMLFHTQGSSDPLEQVEQGIALIKLLLLKFPSAEAASTDLYGALLKEQLEHLTEYRHPESVYHDDLSEVNTPFYFHQFAAQAEAHGLRYLAEADYFEMQDYIYPPPVSEFLGRFGDDQIVLKEQYLDFLKCRVFRQTLLCHHEAPVDRRVDARRLTNFHLASQARPVSPQPELHAGAVEEFRGPRGAKLQTDHSLAKAALLHLGEAWPRAIGWGELTGVARASIGGEIAVADEDEFILAEIMLAAAKSGLIQLHVYSPQFVTGVSDRPVASRLARMQAGWSRTVTNLLHKNVEVDDDLGLLLLRLLDGTRDRAALCDEMLAFIERNGGFTRADGSVVSDQREMRDMVANAIEANLQKIARMALLKGSERG